MVLQLLIIGYRYIPFDLCHNVIILGAANRQIIENRKSRTSYPVIFTG